VLLLVDLDGVVYRGRLAVPGVAAVLRERAKAGDRVIYVTNNSSRHRDEYRARLLELDVPLADESIVTAARATAVMLNERVPRPALAMVLGGAGLARELRDEGIRVVPPTDHGLAARPDTLVVGVDFRLSYRRLSIAADVARRGALFVATNRDPIYPAADEQLFAGAGSIVAAVAVAAGRQPDFTVGKPEPGLFQAAAEVGGARVQDAVVIGDNLLSDIAGAQNVGARSILMLTGVTTADMAADAPPAQRPTAVARDAAELASVLESFSRRR
jgi:HAD superfamily hydrolase (TIGR01450 family)